MQGPAARLLRSNGHTPLAMGQAARVAGEGFQVLVYDVDCGHALTVRCRGVRAIVQRVREASVSVDGEVVGRDRPRPAGAPRRAPRRRPPSRPTGWPRKLAALRIFEDDEGRMNRSVADTGGQILCVSQFTLYGDTRKGNRPGLRTRRPAARPSRSTSACARTSARRAGGLARTWR